MALTLMFPVSPTTVPPTSPVPTQTVDDEEEENPKPVWTMMRPRISVDFVCHRETYRYLPPVCGPAPSVDSDIESPGFRPADDAFIARKREEKKKQQEEADYNDEEFRIQVAEARNQFIRECRHYLDLIPTVPAGTGRCRVVERFLLFLRDSPMFPAFVRQHVSFRDVVLRKMTEFMTDTSGIATARIVSLSAAVLDRIEAVC